MYHRLRPLLFRFDAERAHNMGTAAARLGQALVRSSISKRFRFESERLATRIWGLDFSNPIGIAAGFDKNARLIPFWDALGCGFAEVGSISASRCSGNPRPRSFRIPEDEGLINRMGLNNQGAKRISRRLARQAPFPLPVALNLVKTHDPAVQGEAAIEDFASSFRLCAPLASLVVLNLSCPNTSEGKTFEDPNVLDDLLRRLFAIQQEMGLTLPILLKLSPPVAERVVLDSAIDEVVAVGREHGISGLVASNTDPDRGGLMTDGRILNRIGPGGVSGRPLRSRSTQLIRYLYRTTGGCLPIVGVGGVASGLDAYDKIRAGASLVELFTGLVYAGPSVFRSIKQELDSLLERDGFRSVRGAVGLDSGL
jgi:dihydroorotate dehydrogenase